MMYQRDMCVLFNPVRASDQGQERFDDPAEKAVEPEKEQAENRRHDDDHDSRHHSFTACRPDDPRRLRPDLPDKLTWIDPGHSRLNPCFDQHSPASGAVR